jgi:hypothetical protein
MPRTAANLEEGQSTRLGAYIRKRRETMGLTLMQLGQRVGYKHGNFIGMMERGMRFPEQNWLKYAEALVIEPEDLLTMIIEELHPDFMPYVTIHPKELKGAMAECREKLLAGRERDTRA